MKGPHTSRGVVVVEYPKGRRSFHVVAVGGGRWEHSRTGEAVPSGTKIWRTLADALAENGEPYAVAT